MMEHKQGGNIEYYRGMTEPDPVETIKPLDLTTEGTISDEKKPTIEQLLMHLIEVQIGLTNSLDDLAMSNYALVQAMAGEDEEDGDKGSPYQTLGGEDP